MSQPIYFLPGVATAQLVDNGQFNRRVLAANGLAEIFVDVKAEDASYQELSGPGGKSGMFLCYQTPQERATVGIPLGAKLPRITGYAPEEQDWEQLSERLWIGVDKNERPCGNDLKRKRQYAGYDIELADGCTWTVPVIRRQDGSTELPVDMSFGSDGRLAEVIKDAYRQIWNDTESIAECYFSGNFTGVDKSKAFDIAIRALGLNYRFGHAEQRITKAVDSTNYFDILSLVVDYPRFMAVRAMEKKS